jgi:hypothetical protein
MHVVLMHVVGCLMHSVGYLMHAVGYLMDVGRYLMHAVGYLMHAVGYLMHAVGFLAGQMRLGICPLQPAISGWTRDTFPQHHVWPASALLRSKHPQSVNLQNVQH